MDYETDHTKTSGP